MRSTEKLIIRDVDGDTLILSAANDVPRIFIDIVSDDNGAAVALPPGPAPTQ